MTMPFIEPSKHWTAIVVTVSLLLIFALTWLVYTFFSDSDARRRRIARRLSAMAIKARQAEPDAREEILLDLVGDVSSSDSFTTCYAADAVGRLAAEFPQTNAIPKITDALLELLPNKDSFIQHAAAASLYHMGSAARPKIADIQRKVKSLAEEKNSESVRIILERLIDRLNSPSRGSENSS